MAARGRPPEDFGPQGRQPFRGSGTPTRSRQSVIFSHLRRLFCQLTNGAALRRRESVNWTIAAKLYPYSLVNAA